YLSDELVPWYQGRLDRRLRPGVPSIDMEVGTTDPCLQDPDQDIAGTEDRLRSSGHDEPRSRTRLDQRTHLRASIGGHTYGRTRIPRHLADPGIPPGVPGRQSSAPMPILGGAPTGIL